MDKKECPKCKTIYSADGFDYCGVCGRKLRLKKRFVKCESCGEQSPAQLPYCVKCGKKVKGE